MPVTSLPFVMRLADKMKVLDAKEGFVKKLVGRAGYPIWDKTVAYVGNIASRGNDGGQEEGDTVAFIPFIPDSMNQVASILVCHADEDSIKCSLLNGDEYVNYGRDMDLGRLSSERLALQIMYMEWLAIPTHDSFFVADPYLFFDTSFQRLNTRAATVKFKSGGGGYEYVRVGRTGTVILGGGTTCWNVAVDCIEWESGRLNRNSTLGAATVYLEVCNDLVVWTEQIEHHPSIVFPQSGGSGGAGGLLQTANCQNTLPDSCGVRPIGWHPVIYNEPGTFDPNIADSVRIATDIRDSFPCIYYLIKDSIWNINRMTQLLWHDIFHLNQRNHIYFKIDWNLDCNDSAIAYTNSIGTPSTVEGLNHWTDTISLNPCFLRRSSKELIIGTLLHESVHAFINWCWKEYSKATPPGSGLIDSNYLKFYFPLHWQWFNQRWWEFFANSNQNSHNLMVKNYVREMSTMIMPFTNQNAPASLRKFVSDNIAAGGLRRTTGWGQATDLNDTCNINKVNYWATRFQNVNNTFHSFYQQCSGATYRHF